MIELTYRLGGRKLSISRESIIDAMDRFDKNHTASRRERGTKYFVWRNGPRGKGKPYPPKDILRSLKDCPLGQFSGGYATNQIFKDLEFYVGRGKFPKRQPGTNVSTPTIAILKKQLLTKNWTSFRPNVLEVERRKYPGVYLFALSNQKLNAKPIRLNDIFYVGSSCTGLGARLNQFWEGQQRNCCHSAAMRFYRRWRRRTNSEQEFYVAEITVPCETRKEIRTEKDLCKMGRVAELEYAMIGHIKKRTGFEPLLNRK
jgi:hypothetical protein